MTKYQSAERIINQKGVCMGVECEDCCLRDAHCDTILTTYRLARAWRLYHDAHGKAPNDAQLEHLAQQLDYFSASDEEKQREEDKKIKETSPKFKTGDRVICSDFKEDCSDLKDRVLTYYGYDPKLEYPHIVMGKAGNLGNWRYCAPAPTVSKPYEKVSIDWLGEEVTHKIEDKTYTIYGVLSDNRVLLSNMKSYTLENMFDVFTRKDGSPFGEVKIND